MTLTHGLLLVHHTKLRWGGLFCETMESTLLVSFPVWWSSCDNALVMVSLDGDAFWVGCGWFFLGAGDRGRKVDYQAFWGVLITASVPHSGPRLHLGWGDAYRFRGGVRRGCPFFWSHPTPHTCVQWHCRVDWGVEKVVTYVTHLLPHRMVIRVFPVLFLELWWTLPGESLSDFFVVYYEEI